MKRLNLFVCAALVVAGAASCNPEAPVTQDTTLRISAAYTEAYTHGSQGWIESDKLGMFAYSDGKAVATNHLYTPSKVSTLVESPYMPGYFMYDETIGEVELLTSAPAVELPHGFNEIYLYTPYVEGLTDITAVPLPDLSAQEYVSGSSSPDKKYTFAYKSASVCDCGIVRMGEMKSAVKQMTIVSPTFPASFEGKKVTKVVVAAKSSYKDIAYSSATIDLTTGKVSGEEVNSVEILLPEGGLEIASKYGKYEISTLYLVLTNDVTTTTEFKFTFTVDGVDHEIISAPSASMSSEDNLNMWGQLAIEEPTVEEEETPAE